MISLTILGVICLAIGIAVFAFAVKQSINRCQGNDELFKEFIGNICWGAIVGSLLLVGAVCFSTKESDEHHCEKCSVELTDSTMVIKSK